MVTEMPEDYATGTDLRALHIAFAEQKADHEKVRVDRERRDEIRLEMESDAEATKDKRNTRLVRFMGTVLTALAGSGGFAAYKVGTAPLPESASQEDAKEVRRKIKRNSLQIDNLGREVIQIQETQAAIPDYIIESILAENPADVEKPEVLQRNDRAIAKSKRRAKAGRLLEVSDEQLDLAMEEEESGE